jgi:hypothetical protein
VADYDIGLGFVRRSAGSSPQQTKLKGEPSPSAPLSESEESGLAEVELERVSLFPGKNLEMAFRGKA